jgi:peptidoglycan/LPS O-acetylase OafA/YrhL
MKTQLLPLTSLRFFAAIAVVMQHMNLFADSGSTAVEFFFVLSGFVLTYGYARKIISFDLTAFRKFWILRVFRLYPVYMLTGVIAACLWIGSDWPYTNADAFRSAFMAQTYTHIGKSVFNFNGPSWSVSDEFFFYLSLPFILVVFHKINIAKSTTSLALTWLALLIFRVLITVPFLHDITIFSFGWWFLYISPYVRILGFIQGILLAYFFLLREQENDAPRNNRITWTLIEVIALGSMVVATQAASHLPAALQFSVTFAIPISFVIFVFALGRGYISTTLSLRPLVHLGEISYSIYMIHAPIMEWAARFLSPSFYGAGIHSWHIMAQIGLASIVIGLSDVLYRYIEQPCRDYARQIVGQKYHGNQTSDLSHRKLEA